MTDRRAASIKGWETRKAMQLANGFGPKGRKRGSEHHKVKSVSEILARLRGAKDQASGNSLSHSPMACQTPEAGVHVKQQSSLDAREPETTG